MSLPKTWLKSIKLMSFAHDKLLSIQDECVVGGNRLFILWIFNIIEKSIPESK